MGTFGLRTCSCVGILRLRVLIRSRYRQDTDCRLQRSRVQPFQIFAEWTAQIAALQREFYRGFQESQLVAGVVAFAFVDVGVHFFLLQQHSHAVGELEFAAAPVGVFARQSKIAGVRM